MMHADDLIIFFPFEYRAGPLGMVLLVLREFGDFSGLRLNCKKKKQRPLSAILTQACGWTRSKSGAFLCAIQGPVPGCPTMERISSVHQAVHRLGTYGGLTF